MCARLCVLAYHSGLRHGTAGVNKAHYDITKGGSPCRIVLGATGIEGKYSITTFHLKALLVGFSEWLQHCSFQVGADWLRIILHTYFRSLYLT